MSTPAEVLGRLEVLPKRTAIRADWAIKGAEVIMLIDTWEEFGPRLVAIARAAQTYVEMCNYDTRDALIDALAALGMPVAIGATHSNVALEPWAEECLAMVRDDLEAFGLDMKGCPPMMYNDALRNLVAIVGRKAGFTTSTEVAAYVREHAPSGTASAEGEGEPS